MNSELHTDLQMVAEEWFDEEAEWQYTEPDIYDAFHMYSSAELLSVLSHPDPRFRAIAVAALGVLEMEEALPAIRPLRFRDTDELVRDFANWAVQRWDEWAALDWFWVALSAYAAEQAQQPYQLLLL